MSVKIWRTADWGLESTITAPFKNAPAATFTRLSSVVSLSSFVDVYSHSEYRWSPEGAYVVTPNSMAGPVFVAAVIDRATWGSGTSMVGHENIIEVAVSLVVFAEDLHRLMRRFRPSIRKFSSEILPESQRVGICVRY